MSPQLEAVENESPICPSHQQAGLLLQHLTIINFMSAISLTLYEPDDAGLANNSTLIRSRNLNSSFRVLFRQNRFQLLSLLPRHLLPLRLCRSRTIINQLQIYHSRV